MHYCTRTCMHCKCHLYQLQFARRPVQNRLVAKQHYSQGCYKYVFAMIGYAFSFENEPESNQYDQKKTFFYTSMVRAC